MFPICFWSRPVSHIFVSLVTFLQRKTRYPADRLKSTALQSFSAKSISKPVGRGAGGKSLAAQSISVIYTPKRSGKAPPHQTNASSHTSATSDAPASANGAHWLRRTRVITAKQLTLLIAAVRNAKSRSAKHHQLTIAILNWRSAASRNVSYVKLVKIV